MCLSISPTVCELGFWYCGQITWRKKSTFWHADVSRRLILSFSMLMGDIVHPSVLSLPYFQFCAIADKSLGRNGIKSGLLMYADNLPLATSMAMDIVIISCICPSIQLSVLLPVSIIAPPLPPVLSTRSTRLSIDTYVSVLLVNGINRRSWASMMEKNCT